MARRPSDPELGRARLHHQEQDLREHVGVPRESIEDDSYGLFTP
ncbi:mu-like prophage major head subunit gpT domain protein [Pseudomonas aeruginosa]|nr:mu-like prophage major head subunit gpT domain protein [Pseudomonas aeruginosa]